MTAFLLASPHELAREEMVDNILIERYILDRLALYESQLNNRQKYAGSFHKQIAICIF